MKKKVTPEKVEKELKKHENHDNMLEKKMKKKSK